MNDRAEEKATKTVDVCTHVLEDPDYEPGACSQCIAQALRAYAEEAVTQGNRLCPKHKDEGAVVIYCGTCLSTARKETREKEQIRLRDFIYVPHLLNDVCSPVPVGETCHCWVGAANHRLNAQWAAAREEE